ncbi:hypothetical protein H5P28_14700 [Ruficoccus amylovorans]|uniref:Uncharacterized protein n=1 Tax=Ruficoccus amylovorans TaxID=1804625 RepID=A0A842HG58_9BACT|nr:hypothetical protein [Ruficoccus amylovorans]MBC2595513.1 hypothetical protein [Ruficoccus amylovorans]
MLCAPRSRLDEACPLCVTAPMPSPKDITRALSDWEKRKPVRPEPEPAVYQTVKKTSAPVERRLNPDLFGIWVYILLFLTLLGQLGMLVALDIL